MTTITPDYKPGLEGVIAGTTAISEVDMAGSRLSYRGYPVRDLVEMCTFDEVAYLLLYGRLPLKAEFEDFTARVGDNRGVPEDIYDLYRRFPGGTHPMDALKAAVAVLATTDPERDSDTPEANLNKALRLYARIPNLVVNGYRIMQRQEPIPPDSVLCHNANFFHMLTGHGETGSFGKVFNITQILYAEHGFNASTFSARVTVSTLSDLYSGIVSAIGTLKGPLHGGANEAAMAMLQEIATPENAAAWVRDALAHKKKIMGFGHREYKNGDERAKIVKEYALDLGRRTGNTRWSEISQIVEEEMFAAKGLYPNLDFPVASAYYLMDIPVPLYTPIFVMSRITGWCAHVMEQLAHNRLIRPGSVYDGPRDRSVVPLDQRK